MYNKEQHEHMRTELKDYLHFFGYVKDPSDPENKTPLFEFGKDEISNYSINEYKARNKEALAILGQPREVKEYVFNTRRDLFELFPGVIPISTRHCIDRLHVE